MSNNSETQTTGLDDITVLGEYVLVRQVMKKKGNKILLDAAADDRDKFNYSFEVIQKGDGYTGKIEVGQSPIFEKHVSFQGVKILEKDDNGMISLIIVHGNSIIGIDNKPEII